MRVLFAACLVLLAAGCGGSGTRWHFSRDAGVRIDNAVSAEAFERPDGSIVETAISHAPDGNRTTAGST